MNKLLKLLILSVCLTVSANSVLAQKVKPKTKLPVKQTNVDLGVLRQNTYTNDTFELKIEFPFGWLVGDNVLEAQLMEIQKQSVKATNAKNQAALNQAMARLTPLLGGYRALPGSVAQNSNLKIVVENLATAPKIKTSRDYLNLVKSSINVVQMPAGFMLSEIKNETIDGKSVNFIEIKYGVNQKRNYVMLKKGFAVLLTIDAYSQEDFDELHKILQEADLDYKK